MLVLTKRVPSSNKYGKLVTLISFLQHFSEPFTCSGPLWPMATWNTLVQSFLTRELCSREHPGNQHLREHIRETQPALPPSVSGPCHTSWALLSLLPLQRAFSFIIHPMASQNSTRTHTPSSGKPPHSSDQSQLPSFLIHLLLLN